MQNLIKYYKIAFFRIIKYLYSIIIYYINFNLLKEKNPNLIIYLNTNYINNKINRKSIFILLRLIRLKPIF